jgi:hypothetical protein
VSNVVGVLAYPRGEDFGLTEATPGTARRGYRRALFERANPRTPEYMRALFAERYPDGLVASDVPATNVETIVLLYPDAIGQGWSSLERRLPTGVPVRVLNGRRREFPFDRRAQLALSVRRALERSMLGEALALAVFVLLTPVLVTADVMRGRR